MSDLHVLTWGPGGPGGPAPPTSGPDRPPVVLVHGLTGTAALWEGVARPLAAAGYRVIAPDLRGHGASPKAGRLTVQGLAEDLAALLEQTGPAHLTGHSLGGAVAWTVAAARPDLVRTLVIEDQHPDPNPTGWQGWQDWAAAWPRRFASREEGLDFLQAAGRSAGWWAPSIAPQPDGSWGWSFDFDAIVALARALGETDSWGLLPRITAPTLLLRGEKSPHLKPDVARRMAATIPDCELVTVPGADHWVHQEPAPYAGLLLRFLARQ